MSFYDIALAAHVAGAAAVFLAFGAWLYGIILLGRATSIEQIRTAVVLTTLSEPFVRSGGAVLAIAGLYMAIGTWGLGTSWVIAAIVGALVVGVVGGMVMEPKVKAIGAEASGLRDGPIPAGLRVRSRETALAVSVRVDVALLFGIVVVMTAKPGLIVAFAVLGLAALAGLAWTAATRRCSGSEITA